ncbi:MAG: hypothetical protein FJ296_01805 [Planctomycetes bacterium]|nr:hypothetical protein [Planctomycetota bacterium]
MKNPSITAAFVLVALALVVGGLALSAGGEPDEAVASVLTAGAAPAKPSFESLSPHELRKKGRLEETRRELEQVRKVGKEVAPNVYRIKDESGDPTYFYGDLIEGVGRNGEPLFMTAQFKRLPAVPVREAPKLPAKLTPKVKLDGSVPVKGAKDKSNAGGEDDGKGDGKSGG